MQFTPEEQQFLTDLSHYTIERYLLTNTFIPEIPEEIPEAVIPPYGVFVSVYVGTELRGCIGTFASDSALYLSVQRLTVSAAFHDTRFSPVIPGEQDQVRIEISVLGEKVPVSSPEEITVGKHGIYMEKGGRHGTLLPQVAVKNQWNARQFVEYCGRYKAGLDPDEIDSAQLYVYEAHVFGETVT